MLTFVMTSPLNSCGLTLFFYLNFLLTKYHEALRNFANHDVLIASIMQFQDLGIIDVPSMFGPRYDKVNIFYSTPDYYTQMKNLETQKFLNHRTQTETKSAHGPTHGHDAPSWSVKTDDFFPYADCANCYWTGYFTSRASLKRMERVASSFLLAARQIESVAKADNASGDACYGYDYTADADMNDDRCPCGGRPLYELEDALGVAQHHDGVSGTSKQHVAYDYARRMHSGLGRAAKFVVRTVKRSLLQDNDVDHYLQDMSYCALLNESVCEVSQVRPRQRER